MIYVFIAHGFEEIEAVTVADVLRRADLDVKTVGVGGKTVTGAHGITVHCDISDREVSYDKMNMIVLPGGMPGTKNLQKSSVVQSAIDYAVENNLWVSAICAAPMILGAKGILDGKKATIYPGMEAELGEAEWVDTPAVQDGKFITGNGPSAAIAFSLLIVENLLGKDKATEIGDAM